MRLKSRGNYQIRKVGYFGQTLIDNKLEGHCGQDQGEGQLQTVGGQSWFNAEGHKGQARDQHLKS